MTASTGWSWRGTPPPRSWRRWLARCAALRPKQAAEADPEAAAWSLRTRVRYDEAGHFTLTISGPAQYLPVLQAGIEAKKAELQRQRQAEQTEQTEQTACAAAAVPEQDSGEAPDVSRETRPPEPGGVQEPDVSAETCNPGRGDIETASPAEGAVDLDEQAMGWPEGTTRRDVHVAADAFFAAVQQWRASEQDAPEPPAPQQASTSAEPAASDVSAETSHVAKITDAQALLALAQDALAAEQQTQPAVARRRRPQLTANLDPLSGWGRLADGELLPPTSLRAVMKTLPGRDGVLRLRPVTAADLCRHDLGRTAREANATLRELLDTLDGERCRFPGCTRRKKLHAHHVVYWSDGGSTDLDNLVLVCSRHHTLIHSQGFGLVLRPDRRLDVATAGGVPLLHHPAQPWADHAELATGCGHRVSAETLPPHHCDSRMDLRYVVSVLMAQAA
jgi:hypothetical protein